MHLVPFGTDLVPISWRFSLQVSATKFFFFLYEDRKKISLTKPSPHENSVPKTEKFREQAREKVFAHTLQCQ
jgi:hypothetical protein